MIEREVGDLFEAYPEVIIAQEGHIEGKITTEIEVTVGNQDSEVHLDPLPDDPELHQGILAQIIMDALVVGSLIILQKNVLRRPPL